MKVMTASGQVEVESVSSNRWNVITVKDNKHLGYVEKKGGWFYGQPLGGAMSQCDSVADAAKYVGA